MLPRSWKLQISPGLKTLWKLKLEYAYSCPVLLSESCSPELTVPFVSRWGLVGCQQQVGSLIP